MTKTLSSESADWIPSSNATTFLSTLPTYEDAPPFRVNREGVNNYIRNRGSLNIGDWAIEGGRMSTTTTPRITLQENQKLKVAQPKVLGPDALKNYTKNRCTTPRFICGHDRSSDSRQNMRVRHEGRAIYEKNQNTEIKSLLENYGTLSVSAQPGPHIQGQVKFITTKLKF